MRISQMLFTNQPLDELEEEPGSIFSSDPELCHICSTSFSLLNKKYSCTVCRMPVCLTNSSHSDNNTRICDNCRHEQLVEEIWREKKALKDQLIKNMQKAAAEAIEKEKIVKKEAERIEELKLKFKEFEMQALEEESELQKEVEKAIQDNGHIEREIEKVMGEGRNEAEKEIGIVDRMARAHEKLQILKIEVEEALVEQAEVEKRLEERKVNARMRWEEIRKRVCRRCWLRIRGERGIREVYEVSQKICNCSMF